MRGARTRLILWNLCIINLILQWNVFFSLLNDQQQTTTEISISSLSTVPDKSLPTIALRDPPDWGFRNNCMVLTWFVMQVMERRQPSQILLDSVTFLDLLGTWERVPFEKLFDVDHWNAHYPSLPRLVSFDPNLHRQWNKKRQRFHHRWSYDIYTSPYAFEGGMQKLLRLYQNYTAWLDAINSTARNPTELLMLQGALRPHPNVQNHIDRLKTTLNHGHHNNNYMALHARVEPDMKFQVHCKENQVLNLTAIFDMLEKHFEDPPSPRLFIAINRNALEREVRKNSFMSVWEGRDKFARENLNALNNAVKKGLFQGRVQVLEAGTKSLKNTTFKEYPGVFGALVDYFLALDASIFVGTPVSSFSMDAIQTRFYRNNQANFLYGPEGIQLATPTGSVRPPRFQC